MNKSSEESINIQPFLDKTQISSLDDIDNKRILMDCYGEREGDYNFTHYKEFDHYCICEPDVYFDQIREGFEDDLDILADALGRDEEELKDLPEKELEALIDEAMAIQKDLFEKGELRQMKEGRLDRGTFKTADGRAFPYVIEWVTL